MKLGADTREKLATLIRQRLEETGISYSQVALISGVHVSQVSRICRGGFRTMSWNVVQICNALGVPPDAAARGGTPDGDASAALLLGVMRLWDGTLMDAARITRLLDELGAFRRRTSATD